MNIKDRPNNVMNKAEVELAVKENRTVYRVSVQDNPVCDEILIKNIEVMNTNTNDGFYWYQYTYVNRYSLDIKEYQGLYKVSSRNSYIFLFKTEKEALRFLIDIGLSRINNQIRNVNKIIRSMNAYGLKIQKRIEPIRNRKAS